MKVLVACEFSGVVRDAFTAKGHDAISCDILPTDKPGSHYQGDVFDIINDGWDMAIFHPPCTYLCNSGVRHLHTDPKRWIKMFDGAEFFKRLLDCDIPKICIENPIIHKYAKRLIGRGQDQLIQPYHYGHMETKATCLWLKNLPDLEETNDVYDEMMKLPKSERSKIHYASPGPNRSKIRSVTYQGIANAFADQWG